jgi:hypothetical protein
MKSMQRARDPAGDLAWIQPRPDEEAVIGYDADGWAVSVWVLHAMYEHPALAALGTHDDQHRAKLAAGVIAPLIIGEVNLDEGSTVTGTPLGYVVRPGAPWRRVRWDE